MFGFPVRKRDQKTSSVWSGIKHFQQKRQSQILAVLRFKNAA